MQTNVQKRAAANALQAQVEKLLKENFGDRVRRAGGSILDTKIVLKIEIAWGESPEEQAGVLREKFLSFLIPYLLGEKGAGLLASDFDLPLEVKGKPCKLIDIKVPKQGTDYWFILQTADGMRYKATPQTFLAARARQAAKLPKAASSGRVAIKAGKL